MDRGQPPTPPKTPSAEEYGLEKRGELESEMIRRSRPFRETFLAIFPDEPTLQDFGEVVAGGAAVDGPNVRIWLRNGEGRWLTFAAPYGYATQLGQQLGAAGRKLEGPRKDRPSEEGPIAARAGQQPASNEPTFDGGRLLRSLVGWGDPITGEEDGKALALLRLSGLDLDDVAQLRFDPLLAQQLGAAIRKAWGELGPDALEDMTVPQHKALAALKGDANAAKKIPGTVREVRTVADPTR